MDSKPLSIHVNFDDKKSNYWICSTSYRGIGYIWSYNEAMRKKIFHKPSCHIKVPSNAKEAQIIELAFNDAQTVVLARGITRPIITYKEFIKNEKIISYVALPSLPSHRILEPKSVSKKRKKAHAQVKIMKNVKTYSLANIESDIKFVPGNNTFETQIQPDDLNSSGEIPRGGSVQIVLQQAIHTMDEKLLNTCLLAGTVQERVRTIERLPSRYILPLLARIITSIERKPTTTPYTKLLNWISEIVKVHAAFLISAPHGHSILSILYELLNSRTNAYTEISKLKARLDLVQVQNEEMQYKKSEETTPPINVYNDDDDNL